MKKRVFFVCNGAYHLITSLYYAMSVNWSADTQKILIWTNNTSSNVKINYFQEWFDCIIQNDLMGRVGILERQKLKYINGGYLFPLSKIGRLYLKQKSNNVLICFDDQEYISNKLMRVLGRDVSNKIVLLEDGVSTYCTERLKLPIRTKVLNYFRGIKIEPYIGHNKNISTFIVKNPENMPERKIKGKSVIKQNNFFSDDKWMKQFQKKYLNGYDFNIKSEKEIILWLGQPIDGYYIDHKKEIDCLENIFGFLRNKFTIVVKKHPRELQNKYEELKEKYGLLEIDAGEFSWLPVEIFVKTLQPDIVLTPFSSAAYNIYQTGMRCKIIYCYQLFGLDVGNGYFDKLAEKNNVYNVKNFDRLQDALEQELGETEKFESLQNFDIDFFEDIK